MQRPASLFSQQSDHRRSDHRRSDGRQLDGRQLGRPPLNRRQWIHAAAATTAGVMAGLTTVTGCVPGAGDDAAELVWGRRGFGDGQVLKPRAITIDDQDRLYLADTTGRITRFDVDGRYQMHWRTPAAANGRPTGLGFWSGGDDPAASRILVADTHYYRMLSYHLDGRLDEAAIIGGVAGEAAGQFAFVTDVAAAANGDRFVGEYNAQDRIQRFDAEGQFISMWGRTGDQPGEFLRPQSLMVRDEVLVVADSCNHRIQRFDLRTEVPRLIDVWGSPGEGLGQMFYPYGIDFLSDGNVVVAEYKNARVQLFSPEGRPLAVWGTHGSQPGQMNQPWGVVVDSIDRVHVLDSNNHRVQRFWF